MVWCNNGFPLWATSEQQRAVKRNGKPADLLVLQRLLHFESSFRISNVSFNHFSGSSNIFLSLLDLASLHRFVNPSAASSNAPRWRPWVNWVRKYSPLRHRYLKNKIKLCPRWRLGVNLI